MTVTAVDIGILIEVADADDRHHNIAMEIIRDGSRQLTDRAYKKLHRP